jgi:hypothetical protein
MKYVIYTYLKITVDFIITEKFFQVLICGFFHLLYVFCFPGCVCLNVCRVRKNQFPVCQTFFYTYSNCFLKDSPKKAAAVETAAPVLRNSRMVWHFIHDVEAKKPAVCHVHLNLFGYSSFRIDAIKETDEKKPD